MDKGSCAAVNTIIKNNVKSAVTVAALTKVIEKKYTLYQAHEQHIILMLNYTKMVLQLHILHSLQNVA